MKKKCLFIDRDGTIVAEPPDEQVDALDKIKYLPGVFTHLSRIARSLNYELVLASNQDGLGTSSFPETDFWPAHNFILETLASEGIFFEDQLIDPSLPEENSPNRKPGIGLFEKYLDPKTYDLENSFVIGDRETDVQLAKNLGCKAIQIGEFQKQSDRINCVDWKEVAEFLFSWERRATVTRTTSETNIEVTLSLDGNGPSVIETGIGFFDHMLEQIARHGAIEMQVKVEGDLQIDEHHTVEDTALVLGQAFRQALGNKRGISRYGFEVPMDDSSAKVLIDFGGRPWFIWKAEFKREKIGELPTELFSHFFKSFSDTAQCNLQIEANGDNEHHKIEAIFKAFARAIKMAISKGDDDRLPSTKGQL